MRKLFLSGAMVVAALGTLPLVSALPALSFAEWRFAALATAPHLEIIVDREDGYVELYFRFAASAATEMFSVSPSILLVADGSVDFSSFRQGTADIGNALITGVESTVADTPVELDALSFMLHPHDLGVSFNDPLEAELAVGVCNVASAGAEYTLDQLTSYAGFITKHASPNASITLTLPGEGAPGKRVRVRDFTDERLNRSYHTRIGDDGKLVLAAAPQS